MSLCKKRKFGHRRAQGKDDVRSQGEGGETKPADTLVLDFQPSELGEDTFLLFVPPSLWWFVMAALAH